MKNFAIILFLLSGFIFSPSVYAQTGGVANCTSVPSGDCSRASGSRSIACSTGSGNYCCTTQSACTTKQNEIANTIDPESLSNSEEVTNEQLDAFNPLKIAGSDQSAALSTPGGIISRVIEFAFPIAGLILFVMLFWGGFEILAGAASKKSIDAGKQRITAAVIGFILLFVSYWLIKLIEAVFGVIIF